MAEKRSKKEAGSASISALLESSVERLRSEISDALRNSGYTTTQYRVLKILAAAGEDGVSCSEIGGRLVTRDPDITRLLTRLETRSLLTRSRSAEDKRVIKACITEEGRKAVEEIDPAVTETQKELFSTLSKKERGRLEKLLVKFSGE